MGGPLTVPEMGTDLGSSVHVCSDVGTRSGTSGDLRLYLCLRWGSGVAG